MKVWDARKGGPALLDLKGHGTGESTVAFSPDSTRIVTGFEDGTTTVVDARTGAVVLDLKGRSRAPGGGFLIAFVGGDPSGRSRAPGGGIVSSQRGVLSASVSPDGTRIVTGGGTRRDAPCP